MRKDVRAGVAIGGIFVAVIVVYAVVSSKGPAKSQNQQAVNPAVTPSAAPSTDGGTAPGDNPSAPAAPAGSSAAPVPAGATPGDDHADPAALSAHDTTSSDPATAAGASSSPPSSPSAGDGHAALGQPPVSGTQVGASDDSAAAIASADNKTLPMISTSDDGRWATIIRTGQLPGAAVQTHTPDVVTDSGGPLAADVLSSPRSEASASGSGRSRSSRRLSSDHSDAGRDAAGGGDGSAAPVPSKYTIKNGDTFYSIARNVYGNVRYCKEIMKANPAVGADHLRPGMTIALPERIAGTRSSSDASDGGSASNHRAAAKPLPPVNATTEYRVQGNDSLYKISMRLYKTPNKMDAIYQLNREAIGPDQDRLKLNMILKLPDPPVTANR